MKQYLCAVAILVIAAGSMVYSQDKNFNKVPAQYGVQIRTLQLEQQGLQTQMIQMQQQFTADQQLIQQDNDKIEAVKLEAIKEAKRVVNDTDIDLTKLEFIPKAKPVTSSGNIPAPQGANDDGKNIKPEAGVPPDTKPEAHSSGYNGVRN